MFACLLLGLVVIAPHAWQHSTQVLQVKGREPWLTVWWTTAALWWLACGPGLITGYWAARDGPDAASAASTEGLASASKKRVLVRDVLLVFVIAGAALVLLQIAHTQGTFNQAKESWLWGGAGVGGVALLLLRSLMQPLQQMAAETGNRASQWLPPLLNLASILGLVVLVLL